MAKFECSGLDKLIKKIDKIAGVPEKLKDEIVEAGANDILKAQEKAAQSFSDEEYKHLKITDTRKDEGYCFMDIGIDSTNFDECRGLYFQNVDGERSTGQNVMWMQRSFQEVEKTIKNDAMSKLTKEMDL